MTDKFTYDRLTDEQRVLQREFAQKLRGFGTAAHAIMPTAAVSGAMIGAAVNIALASMRPADVAAWLRLIADAIEHGETPPAYDA